MSESRGNEQEALRKRFAGLLARHVSIPEMKVLLALAYGDPASMYKLKNRIRYTYPAVHGAMKNLEKLGWVKIVERGMSKKNHPMSIYGLTAEGLLWLISYKPRSLYPLFVYDPLLGLKKIPDKKDVKELEKLDSKKDVALHLFMGFDIDSVAKKNAALLPTVLNEWKRLRELGSADELVWHFPRVASDTLREYYCGFEGLRIRFSSLEKIFAYKLFYRYLENTSNHRGIPQGIKESILARHKVYAVKKAVETLTSSPELMKLAEQLLKDMKNEIRSRRTFIDDTEAKIAERRSHGRAE